MSIALDTALYLREIQLDKPLTLTERGLLFTLLFRVGSNPFSWISQETLATELDLDERNIRTIMKKLINKKFVEILKDPTDKRKNLYRPAEFLINYHQQNNRKITKNYRSKTSSNSEITGRNHPVILADTGRNHPVILADTGRNHPVYNCVNPSESPVPQGLASYDVSPKDTYKANNIKINKSDVSVDNFVLPDWLNKQDWDDYVQFRKEIKKPLTLNAKKRALTRLEKLKSQGEDIQEVINQTIIGNWTDFYPVRKLKEKEKQKAVNKSRPGVDAKGFFIRESADEWIKRDHEQRRLMEQAYESQGSESPRNTTRDQFRGNGVRKASEYSLF